MNINNNKKEKQPYIVAVCGLKNSGKTAYTEGLIRELKKMGYSVAAFKHVAHEFESDSQGTDSHRFWEAGANTVAVFSPHELMFRTGSEDGLNKLLPLAQGNDILIIEGGKTLPYPKIAIVRSGISDVPVTREGLIAVATNTDYKDPEVPTHSLDDFAAGAKIIDGSL